MIRNVARMSSEYSLCFPPPDLSIDSARCLEFQEAPPQAKDRGEGEMREGGGRTQGEGAREAGGRDAIAPQLEIAVKYIGNLFVNFLTKVVGKAIGLVGKGILQGLGRSSTK